MLAFAVSVLDGLLFPILNRQTNRTKHEYQSPKGPCQQKAESDPIFFELEKAPRKTKEGLETPIGLEESAFISTSDFQKTNGGDWLVLSSILSGNH
jgi:hypothetical protein